MVLNHMLEDKNLTEVKSHPCPKSAYCMLYSQVHEKMLYFSKAGLLGKLEMQQHAFITPYTPKLWSEFLVL